MGARKKGEVSREKRKEWGECAENRAQAVRQPDGTDPRAIMRLEGLGELKKFNDLMGNRTCDPPGCSIVSPLQRRLTSIWDDIGRLVSPNIMEVSLIVNTL
jgi:hypothetical protein